MPWPGVARAARGNNQFRALRNSAGKKRSWIFALGQKSPFAPHLFKPAIPPPPQPVQCRKREVWRRAALAAYKLAATAHIVDHPCGHAHVIWVSSHLADVKGESCDQVNQVFLA